MPAAAFESPADRRAFFDATATIAGTDIACMVEDAAEIAGHGGAKSEVTTTRLIVAADDVAAVGEGAAVVLDGVAYTIASLGPDGTGMIVLTLSEV